MDVTVRFFASLRRMTGETGCTLTVPDAATLAQAVDHLLVHYPALAGREASWHYAVNHTQAGPETPLHPGDQIAIFPYVAGG